MFRQHMPLYKNTFIIEEWSAFWEFLLIQIFFISNCFVKNETAELPKTTHAQLPWILAEIF